MPKGLKNFIFIAAAVLLLCEPAYAYLDPGSGSLLIYIIAGLFSVLYYRAYDLWAFTTSKLRIFGAEKKPSLKKTYDLVFHCEGSQYWHCFWPVLRNFSGEENCSILIVIKADSVPEAKLAAGIDAISFKDERRLYYFMNNLKAKVVVSTTPQLGVYMLKRSKHVQHYCYLFHAPTDVAFYEKHALDYYDSVLCTGKYHSKSIRRLEQIRGRKEKKLFESGCPYYDGLELSEFSLDKLSSPSKNMILFAPSWGERCCLKKYGTALLNYMESAGYPILFRPHPQLKISDADLHAELVDYCNSSALTAMDRNLNPFDSMKQAALLISDISGIIIDFAALTDKPIILIEPGESLDLRGFEAGELEEIWEFKIRKNIGSELIKDADIGTIGHIIQKHMGKKISSRSQIIGSDLFNFPHCGGAIKEQILSITC